MLKCETCLRPFVDFLLRIAQSSLSIPLLLRVPACPLKFLPGLLDLGFHDRKVALAFAGVTLNVFPACLQRLEVLLRGGELDLTLLFLSSGLRQIGASVCELTHVSTAGLACGPRRKAGEQGLEEFLGVVEQRLQRCVLLFDGTVRSFEFSDLSTLIFQGLFGL